MSRQWKRRARAIIVVDDAAVEVQGLRMTFEVKKSKLGTQPNTCELRVYNLAETTRSKLETHASHLQLFVGYGESDDLLFTGAVRRSVSTWSESDWVTTLYCSDAYQELQEATIERTYVAGTSPRTILADVAKTFGLEDDPLIEDLDGLAGVLRATTLSGSSTEAMNQLSESWGLDWSILDGRVEVSGRDRQVGAEAIVVSPDSGMIGQPVVTDRGIEFTTLLNPRIRVKRAVEIRSRSPEIRVANLFYREDSPKLREGLYIVGEVISSGDTWGRDWVSRVKTFNPGTTGL